MKLVVNALEIEVEDGEVRISQRNSESGQLATIAITIEQVDSVCDLLRRASRPEIVVKDDKPAFLDDKPQYFDDKAAMEWGNK